MTTKKKKKKKKSNKIYNDIPVSSIIIVVIEDHSWFPSSYLNTPSGFVARVQIFSIESK